MDPGIWPVPELRLKKWVREKIFGRHKTSRQEVRPVRLVLSSRGTDQCSCAIIALATISMDPWRLIAILEKFDPSFQKLFFPKNLRCPLENRVARAIEEHWSVYFPTRKECRGSTWSFGLAENEPFYKPREDSLEALAVWKKKIKGTIAEGRAYGADLSWRRFFTICRKSPQLRHFIRPFKPLAAFLIREESMWPRYGGKLLGIEEFFQRQRKALLTPGGPYLLAEPQRLRFLQSKEPTTKKTQMIDLMRQLFDRPLMVLALLQQCASKSKNLVFWLDLGIHVRAMIATPDPLTFRRTWLEHAMKVSGATKSDKACPRKWARLLISEKDPDLTRINAKAIEVNRWLKGKKKPSVGNVRRAWQALPAAKNLPANQAEVGYDGWLFSWMITLWLEKHFEEVAAEFNGELRQIQQYYSRFFYYLEVDFSACARAGGLKTRQP